MKLAKYKIINIDNILAGIRINRIAEKEAKETLLKEYLSLKKVSNAAIADKEELQRKFQQDWRDEMNAVIGLREARKQVVGYQDYLAAENDANKAISDILKVEVDIDIAPIPMGAILSVSDDITLEQIAFLQECGIIE